MDKFELVKFTDNNFEINVRADIDNDTVWLTQKEMALLFEVSIDNISLHIKNILKENELDISSIEESSVVQIEGNRKVNRRIKIYNLDMIISVGYRVKSQRGILFRKWANKILKEYLIQGYSINQKRISALNKTIEIQNKMLASSLNIEQEALVNVIEEYTKALDLLDNYDHQCLIKPKGNESIYKLTYSDCRTIIDSMKFKTTSSVFGVEKEEGKLNGILAAVYQNVFGQEVYPSLEEKAAHLLYFLVKDHPFADGCKRIAATLFLEFLNKNHALIKGGKKIIANDTLVAITVLTAESRPEEKDVMIKLIMNFLDKGK
ncbi:MAG TPA: phosphoribosylaminoimidazolesuccinocarboxamide synthase [Firmicutes bacterium]|nr:phosphoribosylaminoimidazolesuccinocarboxamide synthase [Bacillota bacterium]HAX00070.1 phosphoribosylaminoimidazolesuccinocarboxamide synthase [Bacillota bacterium]